MFIFGKYYFVLKEGGRGVGERNGINFIIMYIREVICSFSVPEGRVHIVYN
jgi:hypothetical protein